MATMTVTQVQDFLDQAFEQCPGRLQALPQQGAVMTQAITSAQLRPGGTVSGPTLMALADAVVYAAILGHLGPLALAVTTGFHMNFYRKPAATGIRAEARLLKTGRRLVVADVLIFNEGEADSVAHASITYSLPPQD